MCVGPSFFPGLQVDQLKCKVTSLEEECSLLRKQASAPPQRETEERGHPDAVSELWAENQRLTASLQELQGMLQVPGGTGQTLGHLLPWGIPSAGDVGTGKMGEIAVLGWPVPSSEDTAWPWWLPLLLGSDGSLLPALWLLDVLTSVTLCLGAHSRLKQER